MTTYIASEVRMHLDTSGAIRAKHGAARYDAWAPFVAAFGEVTILARVDRVISSDQGPLVEGAGVSVRPLPYYSGAVRAVLGQLRLRQALRGIGAADDVFVLRLPELVSLAVATRARRVRARIVSMVVADPAELRHVMPRGIAPIASRVLAAMTRSVVRASAAAVYVSERQLQQLYPTRPGTPSLSRSNIILPDGWLRLSGRGAPPAGRLHLISVGTMEHPAKGFDFLIDVLPLARLSGLDFTLTVVGDGKLRSELQHRAKVSGASVRFVGQVHDRTALQNLLDESDIYVSGSRTEGLPRATIEAMASGLPVVTTDAGAVREIVDPAAVVAVDDADAFVRVLSRVASDATWYEELSAANVRRASEVVALADPDRLTNFLRRFTTGTGIDL